MKIELFIIRELNCYSIKSEVIPLNRNKGQIINIKIFVVRNGIRD